MDRVNYTTHLHLAAEFPERKCAVTLGFCLTDAGEAVSFHHCLKACMHS